ncbi:MAG: hypothetical protein DYG90_08390 [Chloroflexi bacterium CFX6]|nr:hypothetical protein [Chloroflexi bacterium CFX6]
MVLHGPAGCGTSTLGAALANRLRARGIVEHVVRVDGGPSLSADGLLQQLLAALGPEHAPELAGALPHPVGLRVKARALLEDATRAPTAVIVDGAERLLVPGGDRAAIDAPSGSAPAMVSQRWVCADDALAHMLASWITSPHPGLILIFTSHVDFDPLAGGAAVAAAGPAASGADGPAASTGGLGRGSSAPPPGDAHGDGLGRRGAEAGVRKAAPGDVGDGPRVGAIGETAVHGMRDVEARGAGQRVGDGDRRANAGCDELVGLRGRGAEGVRRGRITRIDKGEAGRAAGATPASAADGLDQVLGCDRCRDAGRRREPEDVEAVEAAHPERQAQRREVGVVHELHVEPPGALEVRRRCQQALARLGGVRGVR